MGEEGAMGGATMKLAMIFLHAAIQGTLCGLGIAYLFQKESLPVLVFILLGWGIWTVKSASDCSNLNREPSKDVQP
jgi:hypothetical protein